MLKKWGKRAAALLIAALIVNILFYFIFPDITRLRRENPGKTAFMSWREAQWKKQGIKKQIRQYWRPLARISPYAVKAVVIAEDDKFWSHEGFDYAAIQKAIEKDIRQGRFKSGGSTITQQLVKNLYLSPAKNPVRKLKEALLAWRMERTLSKRRIIEIYLNVAEWGDGIFGIEAAARHYYGRGADALTPREAAALAVVLPSPLRYNPVKAGRYVASRTEAIYRVMLRRGIVIPAYDQMLNEPPENGRPPANSPEGTGADGWQENGSPENQGNPPETAAPADSSAVPPDAALPQMQ